VKVEAATLLGVTTMLLELSSLFLVRLCRMPASSLHCVLCFGPKFSVRQAGPNGSTKTKTKVDFLPILVEIIFPAPNGSSKTKTKTFEF
jgi:hypothetical protein